MLKVLLRRPRHHWVAGGILLALILGIFFRFYQIDRKVFWGDEVFTAMRSSGYSIAEVVDRTYTGEILDLADLQQFQHPAGRTWENTWDALIGNPEQAPLYYLLVRSWAQLLGGDQVDVSPAGLARSIWVWRSFSAVVSLLALPLIYWLCGELFLSRSTGWVAIAMIAVSPFHVLFAQEARLYSLWTVTILLSSVVLLRARRTGKGWWLYALTLTLSFYTFLFSGFVAIAHGIYIGGLSGWRWSRSVAHYLAASALALVLFSPWLVVIWTHFRQLQRNVAHLDQDSLQLPARWLLNLSRLYFDFNHGPSWINPLTYATFGLSSYALYWIYQHRAKRVWLFLLALIGVTGTVLILADLLLGGQRSSVARYPIACYLGIQLAVARSIAHQAIEQTGKKTWVAGFLLLLLVGALSCGISSQAELWWNKGLFKTKDNLKIAAVVNQSDRPLILSNASVERVLSLSYSLKPEVQFLLVKPLLSTAPPIDRDLFLYQASPRLRRQLTEQYQVKLEAIEPESFWKVIGREAQ